MKFAICLSMTRVVVGCFCGAAALAAVACGDGRGIPTAPSASGAVSSSVATPGNAGTVPQTVFAAKPAKTEKPFKGSLNAVEIDTLSFPFLTVNLRGTGNATHLGRFTATLNLQVNVITATSTGTFALIAANGDSVSGTVIGQATSVGSIASIVETATMAGGTGRFADAAGSFTIERVLDQVTGNSTELEPDRPVPRINAQASGIAGSAA
jgi:hypothetical protein